MTATLFAPTAKAANYTWTGGGTSASWSSTANWSPSTGVPGSADTAIFSTTVGFGSTITTGSIGLTTLQFSTTAAGFTIGSGSGDQIMLTDSTSALITMLAGSNSEIINANIILGTAGAGAGITTFNNSSTTSKTLTFGGTIMGGPGGAYKTLNLTGTGAITFSGAISNGSASAINIVDTDTGTVTFGAANTFTSTTLNGGNIAFTANNPGFGPITMGVMTSAGSSAFNVGSTAVNSINLNTASLTVPSLTVQTANDTTFPTQTTTNTITIGTGQNFTVAGNVTIGLNSSGTASYVSALKISGAGSFTISGANTITVNLGVSQSTVNGTQNVGVLDLSSLTGNFTAGGAGTAALTAFNVGSGNGAAGTLTLGTGTSSITATTLTVGNTNLNNSGGESILTLGSGANVINTIAANTINVGAGKGATPLTGFLGFSSQTIAANNGTVFINGVGGTGTPATINIAVAGLAGTGGAALGTIDLRGHVANVTAGPVIVSFNNNTGNGATTGILSFDTGTFTATSLTMATIASTTAGLTTAFPATLATLNVGSTGSTGTFTVNGPTTLISDATTSGVETGSGIINLAGGSTLTLNGPLIMGTKSGASTPSINGVATALVATINVSGTSSLIIGTGGSFSMGSQSGGGTLASTLSITGGTVSSSSDITVGAGAVTSLITLNGASTSSATLNLNGHNIGSAALPVGLSFQSGTLSNVLQINGGAGFTMAGTSAQTLTLTGTNSYSGATTISAGTLAAGAGSPLSPNSDILLNASTAILDISSGGNNTVGAISGSGTIKLGSNTLTISGSSTTATFTGTISGPAGNLTKAGTSTITLSGTNSYGGTTTINSGTLVINSALASPVTVNSGSLSGSGPLTGGVTLAAAGSFATGPSIDLSSSATTTLNINSQLTTNANSNLNFAIGVTSNSQISTSLTPIINGNTQINITSLIATPSTSSPYTLITGYTGTASPTFVDGTLTGAPGYVLGTINSGAGFVQIQIVSANPTAYWNNTNGDGNWGTVISGTSNWLNAQTGGTDPGIPSAGTDVYFSSTGVTTSPVTTTLDHNFNIQTLNIVSAAPVSISNNVLTITPALSSTGISVASGAGAVTINSTLVLGAAQTWTNSSTNPVTLAAVNTGANSATLLGSGSFAQTAAWSGSGGFTLGSGYTGTLTLNQANTFTGTLAVNAGTVVASTVASALGAGTLSLGGGALTLTNASGTNLNFGNATTVTATGSSITADVTAGVGNTYTLGTLSIGGQTLKINPGSHVTSGTAGVAFGTVTLTGNPTFAFPATSTSGVTTQLTLGSITGTGNIATSGYGILTLIGTGTSTVGTVTVGANGTVQIGSATALGASANSLSVASSAVLDVNFAMTNTNALSITGTGLVGGAGALINSSTTNGVYAGVVTLGGATTLAATNTGNLTISGAIGGAFAVTVNSTGSGSVIFSAATNAYTGATTVNQGILSVGTVGALGGTTTSTITLGGTGSGLLSYTGATATTTHVFAAGTGGGELDSTTNTLTLPAGVSLTSGPLTFGGAGNITVGSTAAGTLFTGSNILTKTGSGTLTFSTVGGSADTAAAMPINVSAGTLAVLTTAAVTTNLLGTGTVTLTPGTAALSFTIGGTTDYLPNAITIANAAGTAQIVANGGIVLTNNINFASGSNAATLQLGNLNATLYPLNLLGAISGTGNLQFNPTGTTGPITVSGAQNQSGTISNVGTISSLTSVATLSGTIGSGITAISQAGANPFTVAATVPLAQLNTFTSTGAGIFTFSGGFSGTTTQLTFYANSTGGITVQTAQTLNYAGTLSNNGTGSGLTTISSAIGTSVTGVNQNSATSPLVLSGANTTTAPFTAIAGVLEFANTAALPGYNVVGSTTVKVAVASGGILGLGYGSTGQFQSADVTAILSGVNSTTFPNLTLAATGTSLGLDTSTASASYTGTIANATGTTSFGLVKLGTNTLTLGTANTYNGPTWVQNGTLSVGVLNNVAISPLTASSLGVPSSAANGTISLGYGPTTGVLSYTGTGETTDRVINLAGTTGGGTLDQSGSGTVTIAGNMTFTGTGAKTLTFSGSTAASGVYSGSIAGGISTSTSPLTIAKIGTGTWTLSGPGNTAAGLTVSGGTLDIGAGGLVIGNTTTVSATNLAVTNITATANATIQATGSGPLVLSSGTYPAPNGASPSTTTTTYSIGANFSIPSGVTLTINAPIQAPQTYGTLWSGETGNLEMNNAGGVLVLGGANTYGNTLIVAGTVQVSSIGNTNSTTSNLGGGALVLEGTTATLKYTGTGETSSRNINLAGTTVGGIIDQSGASGTLTFSSFATPGAGNKTLTLQGSTAGTGVFSAAIVDNATLNGTSITASVTTGVTKAGTGTWTLSGINTYTGATTVNGGNLILKTGSLANTAIAINNSGTLSPAAGYSAGNTTQITSTVASGTYTNVGATLALNAGGTLNLADGTVGSFTLKQQSTQFLATATVAAFNGGNINFDIGASTSDSIVVGATGTGLATSSGTAASIGISIVPISGLAAVTGTSFTLIQAGGTLTASSFYLVSPNLTVGTNHYTLSLANGGTGSTSLVLNVATGTTASAPTTAYWTGALGASGTGSWATGGTGAFAATNFATTATGTANTYALPGTGTNVTFTANTASNLNTTLDQSFTINSLTFSGTGTSNTAGTTIAPGTGGTLTINALAVNGATAGNGITVNSGSGANFISAPVALGNTQTWTNNSTSALTASGAITGTSAINLTFAGTGTFNLSGPSTYTGNTFINGGIVNLAGADVASTSGPLGLGGTITFGVVGGGTLQFSSANANTVVDYSSRFSTTAAIQAINIDPNGQTITFNTALTDTTANTGGTLTVGLVGGAGGTLILGSTAANSYKGATVVNAATLKLTAANLTGTPTITVNSGGTLLLQSPTSGTNDLLGSTLGIAALTINTGGTVLENTTAGLQTIANTITMTGGTLGGSSAGNNGGAYAFKVVSGLAVTATSDASGNPAVINPSGGIALDVASTTPQVFTVTRGTAAPVSDLNITVPINNFTSITGAATFTGTGITTLSGANTYSGGTTISGGATLVIGVTNSLLTTGAVTMNVGTLNLTSFSQQISTLTVNSSSPSPVAAPNTINIGPGQTLTTTGAVTIGLTTVTATAYTNLTVTGGGTWTINNSTSNASVQLGVPSGGTNTAFSNGVTLDLTGLSTFSATLGTGAFLIGDQVNNGNSTAGTATLKLAPISTITAATISSDSADGLPTTAVAEAIFLGTVTNTFKANTINIGMAGNRASGTLQFLTNTGTLSVLSENGSTLTANFNVGYGGATTASNPTSNLVDLTGHTATLSLASLNIGGRTGAVVLSTGVSGNSAAVFKFDTGSLNSTALNIGVYTVALSIPGTTANFASGDLQIGGGSVTIGNTGIVIGKNTMTLNASGTETAAGPEQAFGSLEVSGNASVTVGTNGITLGGFSLTNNVNTTNISLSTVAATASLSITGTSTVTLSGSILSTITSSTHGIAAAANVNSTLTLDGGTLNMVSHAIGSAVTATTVPITTLNFYSGTLENVSEINGGASLIKTNNPNTNAVGTLNMTGLSTYTGRTLVSAGILTFDSIGTIAAPSASALGKPTTVANGTIALGASGSTVAATLDYVGPPAGSSNAVILAGTSTDRVLDLASLGNVSLANFSSNIGTPGTSTAAITFSGTLINSVVTSVTSSGAAAKTLILDGTNVSNNTISGAILDNNTSMGYTTSILKQGTGTWVLSGANSYTGTTTVTGGILRINGDNSLATGLLSVTGGILHGQGIIGGHVGITGGGMIQAGNSATTLQLNGGLSVGTNTNGTTSGLGGTLGVQIVGGLPYNASLGNNSNGYGSSTVVSVPSNVTSNDFYYFAGTGAAYIDTTGSVTVAVDGTSANLANSTQYSYQIASGATNDTTYLSSFPAGNISFTNISVVPGSVSLSGDTGGDIYLNFTTAVPEPTALLGLAALGLGIASRRRRVR